MESKNLKKLRYRLYKGDAKEKIKQKVSKLYNRKKGHPLKLEELMQEVSAFSQ